MSNNILYTLLVVGFFALFYLLIILPGRLIAKRKRYKHKSEVDKRGNWMTDPGDPLYQTTISDDIENGNSCLKCNSLYGEWTKLIRHIL